MKYFQQFTIITAFLFLGELVSQSTKLPIPGSVFGMIFFWIALNLKIIKLENVEQTSFFLLSNILLFFVPLGVSLMTAFELIKDDWWKIMIIIITSTIIVMGGTSVIIQFLTRNKDE